MGKKPNDTDSASVRKDKKSKKNKNITSDIDVGVPKDKSHKHKEKKKKSESIEDGDEDRHDKGNLVNSGDLQKKDKKKKRKRDSSDPAQTEEDEPGHKDGSDLVKETDKKDRHDKGNLVNSGDLRKKDKKKKRKRDSSDPAQIEEDEPGHKDGSDLVKETDQKSKRQKSHEDEEHGKGNLVNDGDLQKKDKKKKRKQNSSDTPQIQENESTQNEGPDLKRVSDRQSQSQNSRTEDMFEKNKNEKKKKKKKKKTDGQTTDTETNGIITEESNIKDSQDVKRKKGDGSEEKKKSIENNTEKPKAKRKSKYVSFSDQVEVFPEPKKKTPKTDGLIQGEGPDLKGVSDRQSQSQNSRAEDMVEKNKNEKKKKNKKKKTDGQTSDTETNGIITEESNIKDSQDVKRKKGDGSEEKKSTESIEKNTEKPKAKRKSKKVSFSDQVDVFPEPKKKTPQTDGLIHGKRFTPEEDAIVKEAVLNYIKAHDLGDEGLNMVLNCKSYPGMKNVWREIGACIPYRPNAAIYQRGHTLFERGGKWTPEEIELLKELHKEYGNKWKMMATELGKNRFHVKDMWRRVKFTNVNRGRWSREEYQNLYDLVNLDLQTKIHSEKKSKHGMLRDNIPWTTISEKLETRTDALCCMKWYRVLTSSLVAENKWCDADDYRMIGVLYELDATCVEDVDWDNVLEHRPGEICRKRWDQMVKHIGHPGSKPFAEQVDILAKRYCPDMAETREAWDNKKVVD